MILRQFMIDVGTQEVNSCVMADEETREGVMVDAGGWSPPIVGLVDELDLRITHILITHLHWDHVDGLERYRKRWPWVMIIAPAPPPDARDARIVREGDTVEAGTFVFKVLGTSGHTPESVSYYCAEAGVCFVGDALFAGSVGGTSNDALHAEEVANLRRNILTLPPETELWPGHGPVTTVAIEQAANPFFRPGFGRT